MFVILSLLFATVLAHSYDTYIDLLPAEEKQPFMDKFSRRFMSLFENLGDRNKFDKELLGDQQGTGHLRRRRANYKSSDEENNAEEYLDVIPFNSNKDANHDSDKKDSTSDDENASSSVPIQRRSYDTPKKKSDEVVHNSNVSADSKSEEKDTEEQLFDQTSKGEESLTEKFKDPETSNVDLDVTTEQSVNVTSYSKASTTYEPNNLADENDLYVRKATNNVNSTLKAKSNEKRTVEPSKKSNEEESSTEKLKDPEISTADFSMLTEEQANMISTTESQSFISEVTNYNALRTFEPNDSHDEKDLNIKKATNYNKDDKVTENDSSMSEGESNEKKPVDSKEKSKEEIQTENVKPPDTADIISTTESQDVKSEEINYTAYEPTSYEPIVSGDTNDQHSKEDNVAKMTAKSILLLELDSNSTTASINVEDKNPIRHRSVLHNTNEEGSVLTTDYFHDESTLGPISEPTFAHKQTSNMSDSSLEDEVKNDESNTDETSTKSIILDINDRPTSATKVYLTTTVNYPPISENLSPKVALTASTTQAAILTTSPAAKTVPIYQSPKKTRFQIIDKPSETNTLDTNIANNVKKDKLENELKEKKSINDKKIEVTTKKTGLPHYQVYEIPWPDSSGNPPFLKSDEPMRKLPFPVYKNSPNYLQYNPTNHLQPNVKNNTIRRDARSLRKSSNYINETSNTDGPLVSFPEAVIKKDGELRKFGIYKKYSKKYEEEITKAPTIFSAEDQTSDELDTVTDVELPGSNEQEHPINSLTNGHFHGLKSLLFKNQMNGEELNKKPEYVSSLFNKYNIDNQNSLKKSAGLTAPYDPYKYEKNIDNIDYYFRKRGHRNRKANAHIKILHNLQVQNRHQLKWNNIFIANYAEDKNSHLKRIRMLTNANSTEEFVDLSKIANILKLSDEKDVFPALEKMQAMNLKLMRRNEDIKISVYLKALSDLIEQDSEALKQYDWLATTVQIQSALEKLFLIIHKMNDSKPIHPADIQILKYAMFLHNYLIELKRAKIFKTKLKEYVKLLTREKSRRRNKGGTDEIMLRKVWDYIRQHLPDSTAGDGLNNLNEFLIDVEKGLYDLHQAVRGVSMITKFNHQNWYNNLRQLYLTTNETHLLQLLLHMSFSRLVELMEHSCVNGLEDNYITYMKSHKKEAKRTLEELVFVMMVIDEIKSDLK